MPRRETARRYLRADGQADSGELLDAVWSTIKKNGRLGAGSDVGAGVLCPSYEVNL